MKEDTLPEIVIRKRERLGFFMMASIFVIPAFIFAGFLWWAMRAPVELSLGPQKAKISKGEGFFEISDILASHGIVRSAMLFRLYVIGRGWAGNLQPGEYVFSGTLTVTQVARALLEGPGDTVVTIPEGLTMYETELKLVEAGLANAGDVITLAHLPSRFEKKFPFLVEVEAGSIEGFFFPDTYRFDQRMDAVAIVEKFLAAFRDKVFKELEVGFRESPRSILDIVTMASMIEREASNPGDRRIISGILWRRLEKSMLLQVDATVIYAWKNLNPAWSFPAGRMRLALSELKIDSPYNTYKITGLPPGPIANPGIDAIGAALEPRDSDYWYYLSLDDGTTIYSRNFEEHVAAKAKYYK